MTNKLTDKYLSSTLSTTERYFGLKTKEMSMVSLELIIILVIINNLLNSFVIVIISV